MEKQAIEDRIVDSLLQLEKIFKYPIKENIDIIGKHVIQVLQSHPEIFYVTDFKIVPLIDYTLLIPLYAYDPPTITRYSTDCQRVSKQICEKAKKVDTAYKKVLMIHDLLIDRIAYSKNDNRECHSIVGPLLQNQAVCEGFAKAFSYLLHNLNIPSVVINGRAFNAMNQKAEAHSWNMVNIDGDWYHIDVTFDATIRSNGTHRYDYCLIPNEWIIFDHTYKILDYPIAKKTNYSYYERNNLVMITRKQLRLFLLKTIRSGKKDCIFKLPYTAPETDLEMKVLNELNKVLDYLNISIDYELNYNLKQRVFHISLIGDNVYE